MTTKGVKGYFAMLAIAVAAIGGQIASIESASAVSVAQGTFVHQYVRSGLNCPANQVMVGVHFTQQKVICAELNYGYQVASRYQDPVHGNQVPPTDPYMHGCAPNYLIQGISLYGANDEILTCVSLKDAQGRPLAINTYAFVDGRGSSNNGTQSTIYGLSPTMHVCPYNTAMAGVHRAWNDLYCVG